MRWLEKKRGWGQAAVEFALILAVVSILSLTMLSMEGGIKAIFEQKDKEIDSWGEVYVRLNHGKNLSAFEMADVVLPELGPGAVFEGLPPFDYQLPFSQGGLEALVPLVANSLLNLLGLGDYLDAITDSMIGNAVWEGGMNYVGSGFDEKAGLIGAGAGAVGSGQFNRGVASLIGTKGKASWADYSHSLDKSAWVETVGSTADMTAGAIQGAGVAAIYSEGDWKAALAGGVGGLMGSHSFNAGLENVFSNDIAAGAFKGAVQSSAQGLIQGDFDATNVAVASAGGAFSARSIQGGLDGVGWVLSSGANGAFNGLMSYAQGGDATDILAGAASSLAGRALGEGLDFVVSGIAGNDQGGIINTRALANTASSVGIAYAGYYLSKDDNDTGSSDSNSNGSGNSGNNNRDNGNGGSGNNNNNPGSGSNKGLGGNPKLATHTNGKGGESSNKNSLNNFQENLKRSALKHIHNNHDNYQTTLAQTVTALATMSEFDGVTGQNRANAALHLPAGSKNGRNHSKVKSFRLPHDISSRDLAQSKLVGELKGHGKVAEIVVKKELERQILYDLRRQLFQRGLSSSQIQSILNSQRLKQEIAGVVSSAEVEEAIRSMINDAMDEKDLEAALEAERQRGVKAFALSAQLRMRSLERGKSSRKNIFSRPHRQTLLHSTWDRLVAVGRKLGGIL